MAFLLKRYGKQMIRLSWSSAAAKPPQQLKVLSAAGVNCFSTTSDVNQESNPKDITDAALKDLLVNCSEYFAKNLVNAIQKKPLPSYADFHKHMDDLLQKSIQKYDSTSETLDIDQSEKNPKAFTPEMIKATSVFADTVTGGFLKYLPKPAYKAKGDKFEFTLDRNGLHLTVNVSGLDKEHLVVCVFKDRVLVASTEEVAPDQEIRQAIKMPDDHNYDPDQVTGSIMEGGVLKISFPISKEDGQKEKYFQVNLV